MEFLPVREDEGDNRELKKEENKRTKVLLIYLVLLFRFSFLL
jgi:hypothetical protein